MAGFIDAPPQQGLNEHPRSYVRAIPVIGTTENLLAPIEKSQADCVFVAMPSTNGDLP